MSDDSSPSPTTEPLDADGGRALVEAWRASGLSGAAFCRLRQIRAQRLHYWRERLGYPIKVLRLTAPASAGSSVLPPAEASHAGFVQVVVRDPAPAPTSSVAIVVGGALLQVRRGFDACLLREVVHALGGVAEPC